MDKDKSRLIAVINKEGKVDFEFEECTRKLNENEIYEQMHILEEIMEDREKGIISLSSSNGVHLSESLAFIKRLVDDFMRELGRDPQIEILREKIIVEPNQESIQRFIEEAPYLRGGENLDLKWIETFWKRLNRAVAAYIEEYEGPVWELLSEINKDIHVSGRVFFHLVENKKEDYPFAFMATYAVYDWEKKKSKHLPLKNALIQYGKNSQKLLHLLSTVKKAGRRSRLIKEFLDSGDIFQPVGISVKEAYTFLKEIPAYEESGVMCRIPKWWKNKKESVKMSLTVGESVKSRVSGEALVDFDAKLYLGKEEITKEEIRSMLAQVEGLAFIKGKWVEVDHEKLQEVLQAYEKAQEITDEGGMGIVEALKFGLNVEREFRITCDDEIEISNGEWLQSVFHRLSSPKDIEKVHTGENFGAELRGYQESGLSWLNYMKNLGLGACLADDMGLGKTVQVIALLNYIKSKKMEKSLLVVPASLISNWTGELRKFAPDIKYFVLHSSQNKKIDQLEKDIIEEYDIFITTYTMVSKIEWLPSVVWDNLILDEAQAIKNPRTKQTRTVKSLKAKYRIGMTGTPIENRLSDLWSLFDFLNKGLLGTSKEFSSFVKRMKYNPSGYSKLKKVVDPFILRRVKTDKNVIADLPDKIEMKTYPNLSRKQTVLYSKLVKDMKKKLESSEAGIQRKGLVLSSLIKFKQICNHPSQYIGSDIYEGKDSGKFLRLKEICETIHEKRERVLVFTQFREMTEPLNEYLEEIFGYKGVVIHGGTPVKKRQEYVDKFQGEEYVPFMVLSIKAGGVGLNLTAANHVIHFDRWWNPAVENQATDRAFRIGQHKNVVVHKFITKGTLEEKIDLMIEDKIKLSQEIVSSNSESRITEMSNEEIMEILSLRD